MTKARKLSPDGSHDSGRGTALASLHCLKCSSAFRCNYAWQCVRDGWVLSDRYYRLTVESFECRAHQRYSYAYRKICHMLQIERSSSGGCIETLVSSQRQLKIMQFEGKSLIARILLECVPILRSTSCIRPNAVNQVREYLSQIYWSYSSKHVFYAAFWHNQQNYELFVLTLYFDCSNFKLLNLIFWRNNLQFTGIISNCDKSDKKFRYSPYFR